MLREPLTYWLPKHPVFWFNLTQHSQLGYLWLPTLTVQPLCDLCNTMSCHWSPGASHPSCVSYPGPTPTRFHPDCNPSPPFPREAENFPRGDNHSKHVPLLTYLAWLQPLWYNSWFVFIHVNIEERL